MYIISNCIYLNILFIVSSLATYSLLCFPCNIYLYMNFFFFLMISIFLLCNCLINQVIEYREVIGYLLMQNLKSYDVIRHLKWLQIFFAFNCKFSLIFSAPQVIHQHQIKKGFITTFFDLDQESTHKCTLWVWQDVM